ncbi:hypothetical protein AOQ84DRAFT_373463 [Glonium stellatum]|uniref:Uncharacterized protein n=1 Tax=Glonium stellatum TaxID=574774 RepID=A0A8E2F8E6_9PEZI|nr:hypothetical protein AOQ84DRAFT_373463 [Glonium stellatum]
MALNETLSIDTLRMMPGELTRFSGQYRLVFVILICSLFPLTTAAVILSSLYSQLPTLPGQRKNLPYRNSTPRKRILITGANTPTALTLARLLHAEGHTVIAADHEPIALLSPARVSKAVKKFYRLSEPASVARNIAKQDGSRITRIGTIVHSSQDVSKDSSMVELYSGDLDAILRNCGGVDLWIPCDDVSIPPGVLAEARNVVMSYGGFAVYPEDDVTKLSTDPVAFADFVAGLQTSIKAPETRIMRSRTEIHHFLGDSQKKRQYLLEKREDPDEDTFKDMNGAIKMHRDSVMSMSVDSIFPPDRRGTTDSMVLPRPTMNETYHSIADMRISKRDPWVIKEVVEGEKVMAHALVVDNKIRAFTVTSAPTSLEDGSLEKKANSTPSAEYATMNPNSALHSTLLSFTESFASSLPNDTTTHLNLTFALAETPCPTGTSRVIRPLSCFMLPHSSVSLLALSQEQSRKLANAYLVAVRNPDSIDNMTANGVPPETAEDEVIVRAAETKYAGTYSLPRDTLDFVLLPILRLPLLRSSLLEVVERSAKFAEHLFRWKEETFDWQDPWPWWWQWHVRMPTEALVARGGTAQKA